VVALESEGLLLLLLPEGTNCNCCQTRREERKLRMVKQAGRGMFVKTDMANENDIQSL